MDLGAVTYQQDGHVALVTLDRPSRHDAVTMLMIAQLLGGRRARSAYEVGLVNEILPVEEVLPRAIELVHLISRNAPLAVQGAKEIAVRALGNEPRFQKEYEGPRAFTEKRKPVWRGK